MSDVNAHIGIDFDTAGALAQLRRLQAGLSTFYQTLAEGNLAAANAQKGLNATLAQSIAANGKFAVSQKTVATSTLSFTTALEKNKLSMKEYFRYSAAAATANTKTLSRMFAQEREIINRARRDRVKSLQAQYIQMAKAQGGFVEAMRIMPRTLMMANGQFTELGTRIQYAAQRQQFLNQLLKQGSTNLLNFGKNMQWAGRQLMVGLTIPLTMLAGYASKAFRELEKETIKFKRVYGDAFTSQGETDAAVKNVQTIANEYMKFGVAVKDTMSMAADAAAAGFQGADLDKQIRSATKLAVLGQIEQQQALETTISLQNAFGLSADQLAEKINFLNAVENQTVLSIEDLTIAIPKAAPVVKQLGGNVEDLAFFLTAMKEGGINASEGANALKSGLASLINPTDKASKMLSGFGINIKGIIEANKGDLKGTVVGFAKALDTLDPLNRARAIEQLFGKFQFARLSTLFQNVTKDGSQASRALDLAGKSVEELAILSEREMKKIEESTTFKFQAAMEQFKKDIMPLGKAFLEAVTPIVKFFSKVFEKFNSFSDGTKKTIAIVTGVLAGIGPIALMTFGLMANGIANLVKLFATLRGGIAKLNGQNSILGGGFDYVTQQELENQAASQALHNTHTRLVEVFNVEKVAVSELAASYASLGSQMRTMASQNPGLFAGGVRGAKGAVKGLPPVRKYADGILSVPGPKGAGDVVPAMLSPQEAVIPSDRAQKYSGLITAIFNDKVPGFMAGRLPWGNNHPVKPVGPIDIKGPKPFAEAQSQRVVAEQIADAVKASRYGSAKPTNFGELLQPFSGRSFPIPGVGGVYRKPNGKLVVVKPTIDEKTALAEVRATQIAREVHGLVAPKQTIRTMIDPTDPSGQRKLIVLESPYDPRIAETTGKFTKKDMITQLVASTLRGDKDLQKANLSGNVLADVGTAGVFDRASGFRDFSKGLPSMEEQAVINLLGVKGGAKKFFAQETSSLAAKMTPAEYDAAIKKEINKSIPKLEKLLKSWDLTAEEQVVYGDMLKRLKDGAKTDWSKLQPIHSRAADGVVKAITGINKDASNSVVEEQMKKYLLPPDRQEKTVIEELKKDVNNAFVKSLDKVDPKRKAVINAAWTGGTVAMPPSGTEKTFTAPRQSQFIGELNNMRPIMVDGELKYIHKADLDAFLADPEGRVKWARSAQEIKDMTLYRMGIIPNEKGRLVAGGKFEGRFANIEPFITALRSTGKPSGGGKGNISKIVKPFAEKEINEYNARVGDPLKTKTGKAMLAAGYSPDEVKDLLRENLSHIKQEVTGRQGKIKMKTGHALYDARILNNYMNAKRRGLNILDTLNKDNKLGLTEKQQKEYRKAAEFMARGNHPTNAEERALVAKAAQLDQLVIDYHERGNFVAKKYFPSDLRTPKILLTLFSDPQFQAGKLLKLDATTPNEVFVGAKLGESIVDKKQQTTEKITHANSSALPRDTVPVGRDGRVTSDTRVVKTKRNQAVVTASQARRLKFIHGFDKGNPGIDRSGKIINPTVRQGEIAVDLRRKGYSQAEIDKILRKLAKKELRLKETQVGKIDKAGRVEAERLREQERIQKESTEAAKKRFLKQQHRDTINYAQAKHYDEAVKEYLGWHLLVKAKKHENS
ncbi:MAG: phage tail tape measure protein [Chitinophagia bacterium]|nr:phage tail tape measure protein [Chitinophagia bacterium]